MSIPFSISEDKRVLAEAIFEFHWQLAGDNGENLDPKYSFLPGQFQSSLSAMYPITKSLPTIKIPPEMVPWHVQHQFMKKEDSFPIIQLGNGILTVNQNGQGYSWEEYKSEVQFALDSFKSVHPEAYNKPLKLNLWYRNTIDFDYLSEPTMKFMADNLNTLLKINSPIENLKKDIDSPISLGLNIAYEFSNPKGVLVISINTGKNSEEENLIVLDIKFISEIKHLDDTEYMTWLESAHKNCVEKVFFGLLKGNLEKELKG